MPIIPHFKPLHFSSGGLHQADHLQILYLYRVHFWGYATISERLFGQKTGQKKVIRFRSKSWYNKSDRVIPVSRNSVPDIKVLDTSAITRPVSVPVADDADDDGNFSEKKKSRAALCCTACRKVCCHSVTCEVSMFEYFS